MVDGLGKTKLVDASLKTELHEVFDLEGKDVIELHAGLVEYTDTHQTANEGITFKQTLGVLLVEGQELTARTLSTSVNCCAYGASVTPSPQRQTDKRERTGGFHSIPGSTTNLGQGETNTPDLTLFAKAVLAGELFKQRCYFKS